MRRLLPIFMLPLVTLAGVATAQTTRASLDQLEHDMQSLYRDLQASVVHVQVPVQIRLSAQDHPLAKWGPLLDPQFREQLEKPKTTGPTRIYVERPLISSTQPVEISRSGSAPTGILIIPNNTVVMVDFLGLIIDREGHVLVPLFVNKEIVGESALRVMYQDHQIAPARLLGGDRQTNLAVLQLPQSTRHPIKMAPGVPAPGSRIGRAA